MSEIADKNRSRHEPCISFGRDVVGFPSSFLLVSWSFYIGCGRDLTEFGNGFLKGSVRVPILLWTGIGRESKRVLKIFDNVLHGL